MKKRSASSVIYVILLFIIFLAFCSFAVDATMVYTTRAKLQNITEAAALSAASGFNRSNKTLIYADITKKATNTFNILAMADLQNAKILSSTVGMADRTILLKTENLAPTYFLSFLGVPYIKIEAQAYAVSEELPVTAQYAGINWITASSAYLSDIISKTSNTEDYYDSAILKPLGNYQSASLDIPNIPNFEALSPNDSGTSLSLGPGGFVTIKLPAPIVDKIGPDLMIEEFGTALEGYMVFVGLDVNPSKPYTDYKSPGDGIMWKNVSCSGTTARAGAVDTDYIDGSGKGVKPIGTANPTNMANQAKFYGSGYFDIGAACVGNGSEGLAMAKYLRIVDDNDESAYAGTLIGATTKYYPTMMYGESSSPTSGADIDYVMVLNHVRLLAVPH